MINDILSMESDFSNNEYYGTNVWTEEKFRILSGKNPILLSAPHCVNQIRGDDVREAEKYTGGIVRYICNIADCYGIFQMFTHADPNTDIENSYKNAIINMVDLYDIKLLIDIHASHFKDDCDLDIVTNRRETLCDHNDLIDRLMALGKKYDLKIDENNFPNPEKNREIIKVTSLVCGIPAIRIVINSNKLNDNSDKQFEKIVNLIEEFVK